MQYEPESSTSIKMGESLAGSKVKPAKKLDFKVEPEKAVTPTALHKKVLSNNYYSKYRFQPTVRLG